MLISESRAKVGMRISQSVRVSREVGRVDGSYVGDVVVLIHWSEEVALRRLRSMRVVRTPRAA